MSSTHFYGLTESYGAFTVCAWHSEWDSRPAVERAALRARQGVPYVGLGEVRVTDPEGDADVPRDGRTVGEVRMRGNGLMLDYYRDEAATTAVFADGWFRTGDLVIWHPDGDIELTGGINLDFARVRLTSPHGVGCSPSVHDRSKAGGTVETVARLALRHSNAKLRINDIVISGGENVSTQEVEKVSAAHPAVREAAAIGVPDPTWGEVPQAFVTLRAGVEAAPEEIVAFGRERLAHFKCPRHVEFGELPKTSTGKIQKFVLRERAWSGHGKRIN